MRSYMVQPGQSLADIAVQQTGTLSALPDIAALNGLAPTAVLVPGTTVQIPEAKYSSETAERPTVQVAKAVIVQPGKTLADIAVQQTGTLSAMGDIAALNGLAPTAVLVPGTTIQIPTGKYSTETAERPTVQVAQQVVVQPGQSLPDIAVQHAGSLEAWAIIATLNGMAITQNGQPGRTLNVPVTDKRTVRYFANGGYVPASATLATLEGIDYWIIEQDFTVQ
jgi:LysM repeat protein